MEKLDKQVYKTFERTIQQDDSTLKQLVTVIPVNERVIVKIQYNHFNLFKKRKNMKKFGEFKDLPKFDYAYKDKVYNISHQSVITCYDDQSSVMDLKRADEPSKRGKFIARTMDPSSSKYVIKGPKKESKLIFGTESDKQWMVKYEQIQVQGYEDYDFQDWKKRDAMLQPFLDYLDDFIVETKRLCQGYTAKNRKSGPRRDGSCTYILIFFDENQAKTLYELTHGKLIWEGVMIPVKCEIWKQRRGGGGGRRHYQKRY